MMKVLKFVKENVVRIILSLFVASVVIFLTVWSVSIVLDRDRPIHENCTHFDVSTTILSEPLYENNEPDGGGRS